MRADRLLSLLMLLQTRGRLTARQLAEELEVSERTIYRDIEALSFAGVPVYAERGPGGGCALLGSYRTNLTGLNEDEVRALFMLSIPAPLVELGLGQELKAALLKLAAALPASRRGEEERVRQRLYLDTSPWSNAGGPSPHLHTVYQAVWQDRRLVITYRPVMNTAVERLADPYGLVAKDGDWHLVAAQGGRLRVFRLARLLDACLTGEHFERPSDFNLAAFWNQYCVETERSRPAYPVRVSVSPQLVPLLPHYFGEHIRTQLSQAGQPTEDGWLTLQLTFETLEAARERLLGFGRAMEILEPQALRQSVIDYAEQITRLYRGTL